MAEEKKKRKNQSEKEPTAMDLLMEYSQTMSESAENIKDAADSFGKSSSGIITGFHSDIEKLSEILGGFSKEFRDTVNKEKIEEDKRASKYHDVSREYVEAYGEQGEKLLTKGQKIGQTLIGSFSKVFTYGFDKVKSGFNEIVNAYNAHLTSVTIRLDKTNHEYTQYLDKVTKEIKEDKLVTQFSEKDVLEQLEKVLDVGIRGETSEEMAYRNMITEKLIPGLNTNTKAYTKFNKVFGDTFSQGIDAIVKYSEKVYGAEGIEEGGVEAVLSTLKNELWVAAAEAGLSDKDASLMIDSYIDQYNALFNQYGEETAGEFLNVLKDYMNGNVEGNTMSAIVMDTAGIDGIFDPKVLSEGAEKFSQALIDTYLSVAPDSTTASVIGNKAGIGLNTQAAYEMIAGTVYKDRMLTGTGEVDEDINKDYNKIIEEYRKLIEDLQNNKYQSITAQQEKWNENATAKVANFAAEHIPDPSGTLNMIYSVVSDWFKLWLGWESTKGAGSLIGGVKSLLSGNGTRSAAGLSGIGTISSKFYDIVGVGTGKGLNLAHPIMSAQVGGLKEGLSNLAHPLAGIKAGVTGAGSAAGSLINLAAGPGALIAGGVMMAADAIKASKHTAEGGGSTGQIVGAGVRSALTGRQSRTEDEKLGAISSALSGEKQKFDWKSVGHNALKGAAVGAGVGTAVGGWAAGAGTAIGAGVGAVTGALTNAIDQWVSNVKYDKLADAVNQSTDAFNKLNESQDKYEEILKQSESSQELLLDAIDKESSTRQSSFETLQRLYPEEFGHIKDINELNEDYKIVLDGVIEREKKKAAIEMAGSASEALGSLSDIEKKFSKVAKPEDIKSSAALDAAKQILEAGGENASQSDVNEILNKVAESYSTPDNQLTSDDLIKQLNSGKSGKIFDKSGSLKKWTSGDNIKQFVNDYEKSEDYRNQALSTVDEEKLKLLEAYDSIAKYVESNYDSDRNEYILEESSKERYASIAKQLSESIDQVKSFASQYNLEGLGPKKSDFVNIDKIFETLGVEIPQFKIGAYNISKDGTLAELHEGEMVLAKDDADLLRSLVGVRSKEGVSEYLQDMIESISSNKSYSPSEEFFNSFSSIASLIPEEDVSSIDVSYRPMYRDIVSSKNDNEEVPENYEPVVSAIKDQTDTLSEVLERIYIEINGYFKKIIERDSSIMSERLVSFRGL